MAYTNSPLVNYTKISPNRTQNRTHAIDTITIHCVVGQCSVETLGNVFAPASRQASANYGVGYDGKIGLYVEEKDRSWCSSNAANDHRAVTIEVASDTTEPYAVRPAAYNALIKLVVDICKRNGIKKLVWSTDKNTRVNHLNGANMTVHRDYANKSCPGTYLYNHMGDIASQVNAQLGAAAPKPTTQLYRVRKTWTDGKTQKGAFHSLVNAQKCADDNPGYSVFDEAGKVVYTPKTAQPTPKPTPQPTPKPAPKNRVKEFQQACTADGLPLNVYGADGIWGKETEACAKKTVSKGAVGQRVKLIQTIVIEHKIGLAGGIDSKFGDGTLAAVREFQKQNKLTIDGVVGLKTWKKLLGI